MPQSEPIAIRMRRRLPRWLVQAILGIAAVAFVVAPIAIYTNCRIDVPAMHLAVLTRKTGINITNDQELAPDENHKGLQKEVLNEGRYFYNPYRWDWDIYEMIDIPVGKMGVRVRLYGDDLPYGHFVATTENQKGIVEEVLKPGRYAINGVIKGQEYTRPRGDYLEIIELHDPITISGGYRGVVTNLAGPIPIEETNTLLVAEGKRGVQEETLDAGTYYWNPYMNRIEAIDCRSQRFNLAEGDDMGFPSKDGFWVSLDGIVEFRVKPESAATVYVTYNEDTNDEGISRAIDKEIIRKVIMPNARAFCRLKGSDSLGKDFIGAARIEFQNAFQEELKKTCEDQGIEIVHSLITKIKPPEAILLAVRMREVAGQQLEQYKEEQSQQKEEALLAEAKATILQKQRLVEAQREVVKLITEASKKQDVAMAGAERDKNVAELAKDAAEDRAAAITLGLEAEAIEIRLKNKAEAAGWQTAVKALDGDGKAYARYVLFQRLAPGFRSIMTNTADSPLMEMFRNFSHEARQTDDSSNEKAGD